MSLPKADNSETPPPQPPATIFSIPPLLIAITLGTVVVCFVGFSVVYFFRCCFMNIINAWAFQSSASGTVIRLSPNASPYRGLDPSLLQTFPTFLFATIKDHRKEKKYSLECAICLLQFEDDNMLRLLIICFHVFHQECIDLWLRSHKTCPVCRRDLDSPSDETRKSQELAEDNEEESMDHVCIDVKEGDSDKEHGEPKFLRSHSTGHSIVMIREGDEGRNDNKYRLRLVEHVALKIVKGGHNHSKSCSSYKDMARHCSNCGYVQTVFGSSSCSGIENI